MNYYMPTRLFTGTDCVYAQRDKLLALGKQCVIVTEPTASKASGALADVERALEDCGITPVLWQDVTQNPPLTSCMEAGRIAAEARSHFVLGIGGGSALDAAKAIAVFATNPELTEQDFYAFDWKHDPLPIVLVGTTAGTGSEVTKVSVLTDSARRKHSIHDDRLYAAISFGDSRYTHSCPRSVTLSCGVDVLAHAVESYFSHKSDEISRAFAIRAVRLAREPLAAATDDDLTSEARQQLYEASILGGLAINTTGTCYPHNVGYYLTENYGIPHGFASAVFLPSMLARVRAYDPAYTTTFYNGIGFGERQLVDLIERCLPSFECRMMADEVAAALPRWEGNGSVLNTRADISVDTIQEILLSLFVNR